MEKIKAISFDFWNTLYRDLKEVSYRERRLQFLWETVRPYQDCHMEQVIEAFTYTVEVCNRIWSEEYRTPIARERLEMMLVRLAVKLPEEELEELARWSSELLYDYPPTLIEGVTEVLKALAPHYKLAVISDTGFAPGRVLRELMRRNHIYEYFEVLTFSDEAGRSKPHESVFLRTTTSLGISPQEMLHIGDLEVTDIAGAKAVGAKAVLFSDGLTETTRSKADFIIRSHLELPDLLKQLE
ncbi:MAG: HAD family hydrolase [Acidobacteriota bacterium]